MIKKNFDKILAIILVVGFLIYRFKILSPSLSLPFLMLVAFLGALPVIFSALGSLKNKKISVDFLAAIALIASMILKEWSSAIFINLMLVSARILDSYSENRANKAIKSLLKLRPQKIKIKTGESVIEKNITDIKIGDLIVIESGDRVAADGEIVRGEGSIDQSSLTGESIPVSKKAGDKVLSSTLVVSGSLVVRAEKIGKDTMLERIIDLVEGAHRAKPELHNIADRFASNYVVLTLIGAIALYFLVHNSTLVLSILLVACADDIAVAIPVAFLISIGKAAKRGIIIKGGNILENITKVKQIIVDKTGTLTIGRLVVEKTISFGEYKAEEVLKLAAVAEFFSNHAAAKAINGLAVNKKIFFKEPDTFEEFPGRGSTAVYENKMIVAGKTAFLQEKNIGISEEEINQINKVKEEGLTSTLVAYDGKLVGLIALADQLRPEVKETIISLKKAGIEHWVMLTGDNEKVAQKIALESGINEFHANLLPQDKLDYVKRHLSSKSKLAMVGDGVNDAAALALADVGIAMGAIGSDAAIEAADVALMKDDFSKIPEIIAIGKNTMKISYQNFWIWGIVNVLGFMLVFTHFIGPQGASAYNFITDFFPLINSARLFRIKSSI